MNEKYKCFSCNHSSEDPEEFLEFIGNVAVPGQGGIIGNNLSFGPNKQFWEPDPTENKTNKQRQIVFHSDEFRLYSFLYCLSCTSKILSTHFQEVMMKKDPSKSLKQ